jgi:hypothetical protein
VLCLADPAGDTAQALLGAGIDAIARLDDADDIAALLRRFLFRKGEPLRTVAQAEQVQRASRRGRTETLAGLLTGLARSPQRRP